MGDERAERIIELFALATGLPHEEQAAFLDAHCGADLALRAELASLLHHHALCDTAARAPLSTSGASSTSARSGFLAEPAAILPPPLRALTVGQRVGERYVIERQLAEGGMGVVYLAIQEAPVRRRVAVKLVRADLSRRDARLRFELER